MVLTSLYRSKSSILYLPVLNDHIQPLYAKYIFLAGRSSNNVDKGLLSRSTSSLPLSFHIPVHGRQGGKPSVLANPSRKSLSQLRQIGRTNDSQEKHELEQKTTVELGLGRAHAEPDPPGGTDSRFMLISALNRP